MTLINSIRTYTAAVALVVAFAFAYAPAVQAADLPFGDFYPDQFAYESLGGYDFYPDQYMDFYPDQYVDFYPDQFAYDYGSGFSYGGGSFLGGMGGWSFPGLPIGGSSGGNRQSQSQAQSQSSNNTNTNVNNNVITIGSTVAQTPVCPAGTTGTYPNCVWPQPNCPVGTTGVYPNCIYPQPPQYDICPNLPGIQATLPPGYYIQNGYCYQSYTNPVYPTHPVQPYVTLSAVPYTGLEMGPVATALYWGFLVLWCLLAAYLIAVKKVHNTFVAWLVGSSATKTSAPVAHATHAPAPKAPEVKASNEFAGIDPFIASQIAR